ncbi:uncharacterized protein PG986_008773 [Apiospora aurea]|uniref:Methyltransferase domain-containing protein n=1 Tax=Apiospora aurea TaxID=335848 RepID=A0ABR1Q5T8_9PEZI
MGPMPVSCSFNTELSAPRPFAGFGDYAGANVEPLLPMEGQGGFQAQAPIFQSPGYVPTYNHESMNTFPVPDAHFMPYAGGNDSGGNDGFVLSNSVPPAVPRQQPADATPRELQLPSQLLEARQAGAQLKPKREPKPYDESLISVWHPHEFLPEDYPELDQAYAVTDPANPPRIRSGIPQEAWIPGDIYRVPTGTSIVEPESVQGENGRLYNGYREGKYFLPNDPDRLDLQHQGLKILLGDRLFLAPIKDPKYVLDLATGTGIWPIDFAELFPNAQVIGTDLSQIQPDHKPPNVTFVREDSEEEWCYDHKFDYIHARAVVTCFDNPKGVMEKAFENLSPGGYLEYLDCYGISGCLDGTLKGTGLEKLGTYCVQGAAASGRDLMVATRYKEWLEEIGFVDVVERKLAWPYGAWAKSRRLKLAGLFCQRDFYDGVSGIAHVMLKRAGMSNEEIEAQIAEFRSNLVDPAIHAYLPTVAIYGRKPNAHDKPREGHPETSEMPPPTTKRTGFMPQEFLPEDFPAIDPLYTRPDVVSAAAVPPSQSGIPPEAWVPAEVYRESSGGSVVEPNSITEENGRTYHGYKDGKYWIPNDPTEQERLDLQHCTCTLLLHNRLYLAPLQNPKNVLDIATGTGLWAMEFAREHPGAHIIGIDLSKIQPENPPDNVEFIRDDAEEPWGFGPTRFDYVHVRFVFSCFNDPRTTEFASLDGSIEGTTIKQWGELMRAGAALRGEGPRCHSVLQEVAGGGRVLPACWDPRMKHVGRLGARNLYDNISGISYRLMEAQGYSQKQIEEFASKFRADIVDPTIHSYRPL